MSLLNWTFRRPVDEDRWVVLDLETTGLDPRQGEVLHVAALAVHRHAGQWRLVVRDSLDLLIRPRDVLASQENVLIHGLGLRAQSLGAPAAQALPLLRQWVGCSPVLAFHADFDRSFLAAACKREKIEPLSWRWLDLARVLPLAFPQVHAQSLDAWMDALHVVCPRRHNAVADAWATAQLWLQAAQALPGHEGMLWHEWRQLSHQGRWLSPNGSL